MFKKYEKTFMIKTPSMDAQFISKRTLSTLQVDQLVGRNVVIEEKLDGANVGIVRHKDGFDLQKRGSLIGHAEHPQFQFFQAWANTGKWLNIMDMPSGYIVYGELLRCVHTIYYDNLPDWMVVFDVFAKDHFLNRQERNDFCEIYGFSHIPLVSKGKFSLQEFEKLIPTKSAYGDFAEGIVIKRYDVVKKDYVRGKIIKPEFFEKMDEIHWSKLPIKFNKLRED